jgi:hypothetical protein
MASPINEHLSPNGFLGGRKNETSTFRERTLSNVSCISNSTWWSAAASVSGEHHDEEQAEEKREKKYQAVTRKCLDSGVALENVQERRESIKSTSTARSPRSSRHRENERPPSTRDVDASRLKRQNTSTSGTTVAASHYSSRRRPSTSMESSTHSTSGTTLQGTRPSSSSTGATAGNGDWKQWSWDSAQGIAEARRQKRLEIKQSLTQKYPNDRVHGEFLPFSTGFAHSADSLSPVKFDPQPSALEAETDRSVPTILDPVPIAWKDLESLRAEYAAVDKKKRSPWMWIRRRVLCGSSLLGCGASKEFWEDGDEDRGSVRRYRLELPDKDEVSAVRVPVKVRSVDMKPDMPLGGRGGGELMPPFEEEKTGKERWSTAAICEGKRIDTPTELPKGFREAEPAVPVLGSTVRGVV